MQLVLRYLRPIALLLGIVINAWGQTDSIRTLDEIVISSHRITTQSVGYRLEEIDSFALASIRTGNLAEALIQNTGAQIRSYGPGGLAGINLRGSGNNHTAILWNGINLQSPSNGELDLSQLPVTFVDNVQIQYGGAASLYGNGSIGGSVHLNNALIFDQGLQLELYQNLGSFGRHNQSYGIGWSNDRLGASLKLFRLKSDNDFEFRNTALPDSPTERRAHNRVEQNGFLFQNYWQWNPANQISLRVWFQDNALEVPGPVTAVSRSDDEQFDNFSRTLITWSHQDEAYSSSLKTALIRHETVFGEFPETTYQSVINEYAYNRTLFKSWLFDIGANHTYDWVTSLNYGNEDPDRHRTSVFVAARKNLGQKLLFNLRARQLLLDGSFTPFTPSFGAEYFVTQGFSIKGSVARNYLVPTLNQLYWRGAGGFGNPQLQPELSWNEEIGLAYHSPQREEGLHFTGEATLFSNQVQDWILWIPVTSSEWSPENIKSVWSRGMEAVWDLQYIGGLLSGGLRVNYNYTKATNQSIEESGNGSELGKQLIYTPQHAGKIRATLVYEGIHLGWWQVITGRQYTDGSNTEIQSLDPFGVSNMIVSKTIELDPIKLNLQFEINNLFNAHYYARAGYPMPLRNYRIGLSINYN